MEMDRHNVSLLLTFLLKKCSGLLTGIANGFLQYVCHYLPHKSHGHGSV